MPTGIYKRKRKSYNGRIFGNWKIIKDLPNDKFGGRVVLCIHLLNKNYIESVRLDSLKAGTNTGKQNVFDIKTSNRNKDESRIYRIWRAMRQRCYNKNHKYYKNYGGRNIKIE